MKKTNFVYDATILCNILDKNFARSGIFWVAYNLAKELAGRSEINFSLYCSEHLMEKFINAKNTSLPFLKDVPICNMRAMKLISKNSDIALNDYAYLAGLHALEEWGAWSRREFVLKFLLDKNKTRNAEILMKLRDVFPTVTKITAEDAAGKKYFCYTSDKGFPDKLIIHIDQQDIPKSGKVEIRFTAEGASSPFAESLSNDSRVLGIAICAVKINLNTRTECHSKNSKHKLFTAANSFLNKLLFWRFKQTACSGETIEPVSSVNCDRWLENTDVFFSPFLSPLPEISEVPTVRKGLVLYDVIPFLMPGYEDSRDGWCKDILNYISGEAAFFPISHHTKHDFLRLVPSANTENFHVINLSSNLPYTPIKDENILNKIKNKYKIPFGKKYIFSLCTLEDRKNLIFAIKNFVKFTTDNKIDDFIFILGGDIRKVFVEKLDSILKDIPFSEDKIIYIGYVDDEDLNALYSGAHMFVYPSLYEGFGMPILEAMMCGVPVICSNTSSMPEVIGDCGIAIDPTDDKELLEAYHKMYYDDDFRAACVAKALERSKQFTWSSAADEILRHFVFTPNIKEKLETEILSRKPADIAVYAPLLPADTGVANFHSKLHSALPEAFDTVSDIRSDYELERVCACNKELANKVIPHYFHDSLNLQNKYTFKIFVISNGHHSVRALKEAIKNKDEDGNIIYLHEATLHSLWMCYIRKLDWNVYEDFMRPYYKRNGHKALGIRPLVKLTGIKHFWVNNEKAKELVLKDLPIKLRKKIKVDVLFHPVEDLRGMPKTEVNEKKEIIVGVFGFPNDDAKGTRKIIEAVKFLNQQGTAAKALLAGYRVNDYVKKLPEDLKQYVIDKGTPSSSDFLATMNLADVAVQLRECPGGESSGCINQLLGMGKPVVTSEGFVPDYQKKFVVSVQKGVNPTVLAKAIIEAINNPVDAKELDDFIQRYSYKSLADIIKNIAAKAAGTNKPAIEYIAANN